MIRKFNKYIKEEYEYDEYTGEFVGTKKEKREFYKDKSSKKKKKKQLKKLLKYFMRNNVDSDMEISDEVDVDGGIVDYNLKIRKQNMESY